MIVSTDPNATAEDIIARYAARWSLEVAFFDAKNIIGVGEARNRVKKAVERTVPFTLYCQSVITLWYTINANPTENVAERRRNAPWYPHKKNPSTIDMLTALRRAIITHELTPGSPGQATPEEIQDAHSIWDLVA